MALTKIRGTSQIKGGSITNAEISASAGIELSKLAEGAELIKRDGSVAFTGDVDMGSNKVTNVADGVNAGDVANKGQLDAEATARAAADTTLQDNIDAEATARAAADSALDARMTTAEADIDALEVAVADEATARAAADTTLQDNIDAEAVARAAADSALDARMTTAEADIDALEAADVVHDGRLADLENGLSAETTARTNADTALQADIDAEEARALAAEGVLQANIDAEEARALAAEGALDERLVDAEENLAFPVSHLFEDNSAVYADADPGVKDPSSAIRDGWYYTNANAGDKVNWYFYDGTSANTVAVDDLTSYAVVTLDSLSSTPFMVVYTRPTGTNDIFPGFAHASKVYLVPSGSMEVGKKYLIHVGEAPNIHTDLPRVQLVGENENGDFDGSQIVMTTAFSTNSSAAVGNVKMVVEGLGVSSASYKQHFDLRIRVASQVALDAEIAARIAGDASAQASVDAEEARALAAEGVLQANIDAEASARASADSTLQANIDAEASARASADSTLQANIDAEAVARADADTALQADIDAEEARALAAEGVLQANIDAEESARIAGDASTLASAQSYTDTAISNLVDSAPELLDTLNELAAALGDDPNFATTVANQIAAVQAEVDAEEARALAAEATLQANIDAEATARAAADSALDARMTTAEADIDALEGRMDTAEADIDALEAADVTLQANIDAEATARADADTALQAEIDAEEARALAAEGVLQDNIDAEEARALAAEGVLQDNIDAEATTRANADATLQANIDAEASARTAADTALQAEIDAEEARALAAEGVLQGNIDAEASARASADTALQAEVDALEGRMDTAEADIDALEASVLLVSKVVTREAPAGAVDGSNVEFVVANSMVLNSEHVYMNGLLQEPGVGNDYTISGSTITFASAPVSGDRIRVSYLKA